MNKFKTMEWIRSIRDKNYNETKKMGKKELLEYYKMKECEIPQTTPKK